MAIPTSNIDAETTAQSLLKNWICLFGAPHELHSDQGKAFEAQLFKQFCKLFGIEKTRTTAYHPQTDGMIEHHNRTLESMLRHYVSEEQDDWDCLLPQLYLAYNSSKHPSTGYSPNELLFGRQVVLPLHLVTGLPSNFTPFKGEACEYVEQLQEKLEKSFHIARTKLKAATMRQKRNYDKKKRSSSLCVGQEVLLYNPKKRAGRSPKLATFWEKGWEIKKLLNPVLVTKGTGRREKSLVVHHDRILPLP